MKDRRKVIHLLDPEHAYHTRCGVDTREALVPAVFENDVERYASHRVCTRCEKKRSK